MECLKKHLFPYCNSILRASIEKGFPRMAVVHYKSMLIFTSFHPDQRTYALLLKACSKFSNLNPAMQVHSRAAKTGFLSHRCVVTQLLQLYIDGGCMAEAQVLFDMELKWDADPWHANLMIMGLLTNGETDQANQLFKRILFKDLVSWNSMIAGFAKSSHPDEAMSFFRRMVDSGIEPDGFSFSAVLSACARVGALCYGEWIHHLLVEKGIELNYILGSALIDMYAKCGRIDIAKEMFNAIPRSHISIWNTMIGGLARHGLGLDAVEIFSRIEHEGLVPDGVTFVAMLTACSHCGMVEEAQFYFDAMKTRYLIDPKIEHYGAMVDALARSGKLDDAHNMIRSMSVVPDVRIWRALLGACRRHRCGKLGEVAIDAMVQRSSGDYVLLSSIYSSMKRWDHAENVWKQMKEAKVRKNRGLSWVELGGSMHRFKARDRSHPNADAIYKVLNRLATIVKAEGFVPMTELVAVDVSEEEREENLNCHSEKLAVAFSVLETAPGTEIRVTKNLSTCSDCHEWLKTVSKVLRRVILVRDRIRFHRFERGSCSCKDYW